MQLYQQIKLICRLDPSQRLPPIHLAEQTTFKLSFTVIDPSSGEGVSPKQAHLLFEDTQAEEDVTMSIGVKANGRASFTLVRPCPFIYR